MSKVGRLINKHGPMLIFLCIFIAVVAFITLIVILCLGYK